MPHPTLRQLDIFAAVVRSGDIHAIARELDRPPSDVAAEVRALEARIGHRLLEAGDPAAGEKPLVLTPAGRRMVEALRLLEQSLKADALKSDSVRAGAPRPGGRAADSPQPAGARHRPARPTSPPAAGTRLVFATHPSLFAHFREALTAFEEDHPETAIDLDLDCFTASTVERRMAEKAVDIAYFYALESDPPPGDYVWTERLSLFVGETHRLAGLDLAHAADLTLESPILLARANPLRPLIGALLDQAGFGAARPLIESDDYARLLDVARTGQGFLPMFGEPARQATAMPGIRRLPFADPLPALQVRRAIGRGLADHPLALDLVGRLS